MLENKFKDFKKRLVANCEAQMALLLPNGVKKGKYWCVGSISGEPGSSLKVNLEDGLWQDYSGPDDHKGDLLTLFCKVKGMSPTEVLNHIEPETPSPVKPVKAKRKAKPKVKKTYDPYKYSDEFHVTRTDYVDGTKNFKCYNPKTKQYKAPKIRPLFKLGSLDNSKGIFICEGEECALFAKKKNKSTTVVTWSGGSNAVNKTDWSEFQIAAKNNVPIRIWPDCDDAGYKAMSKILEKLLKTGVNPENITIINPRLKNPMPNKSGWDIINLCEHFNDSEKISDWIRSVSKVYKTEPEPIKVTEVNDLSPPLKLEIQDKIPEGALLTDIKNNILPNQDNIYTLLTRLPRFKDLVYYDTFYKIIMYKDESGYVPIKEHHKGQILMTFQGKALIPRLAKTTCFDAIDWVAFENQRSSMKEWLESLKWDGVERAKTFFTDYVKSDLDTEYLQAVGENMFTAMAARIVKPGCKFDNMIILDGKQGVKKSTVIQTLAGEVIKGKILHTSLFGKLDNKDTLAGMNGKLICEMEELAEFLKASDAEQKRFVSAATDSYRAPYDKTPDDHPRQSILIGTTCLLYTSPSPRDS